MMGAALRAFDPRGWRTDNPTETLAMGIQSLRSGLFLAESVPLLLMSLPGRGEAPEPPPEGAVEITLARLRELLERDAALIGRGDAPLSVLLPRDPFGHGGTLLRILLDVHTVTRRRRHRVNMCRTTSDSAVPLPMIKQAALQAFCPCDVHGEPSTFGRYAGEDVDTRKVTEFCIRWTDGERVLTPCCDRIVHQVTRRAHAGSC